MSFRDDCMETEEETIRAEIKATISKGLAEARMKKYTLHHIPRRSPRMVGLMHRLRWAWRLVRGNVDIVAVGTGPKFYMVPHED